MRRSVTLLLLFPALVVGSLSTATADDWAPPSPKLFVSQGGTYGFKVLTKSFETSTTTKPLVCRHTECEQLPWICTGSRPLATSSSKRDKRCKGCRLRHRRKKLRDSGADHCNRK